MTIKEAAKLYGISTQAVYQRLKKANINLDTLKDKETGEITGRVFCASSSRILFGKG